jgi:hypothetical protein
MAAHAALYKTYYAIVVVRPFLQETITPNGIAARA